MRKYLQEPWRLMMLEFSAGAVRERLPLSLTGPRAALAWAAVGRGDAAISRQRSRGPIRPPLANDVFQSFNLQGPVTRASPPPDT